MEERAMETAWQDGRQLGPRLPIASAQQSTMRPPPQQHYPQQHIGGGGGLGDASFIGGLGGADPQQQLMAQTHQAQTQAQTQFATQAVPKPQPHKPRKQKPKKDKKAEIQQKLAEAWTVQWKEMQATTDFRRGHILPLARIKKIMKIDEDVRMISAEAPIVFGKACELFIIELTMRAWQQTEQAKRRTLQKNDVRSVVMDVDVMDFLMDVVPPEEPKTAKSEGADQEGTDQQQAQMQSPGTAQMAPQDLGMQMVGAGRLLPDLSYGISSSIDSRVGGTGNGEGLDGLSFGSVPR